MDVFYDIIGIILNVLITLLKWIGIVCIKLFWFMGMLICSEFIAVLCASLIFGVFFSGYRHWLFETAIPGLSKGTATCFRKLFGIEENIPQFLKKDGTPDMRYAINRRR